MTRMAAPVDQEPSPYPTWEVGSMVRVDGPMTTTVDDEGDKMPDDCCAMLPPEITDGSIG